MPIPLNLKPLLVCSPWKPVVIGLKIPTVVVSAICRVTAAIKFIFLHAPSRVARKTRSGTSKIGA